MDKKNLLDMLREVSAWCEKIECSCCRFFDGKECMFDECGRPAAWDFSCTKMDVAIGKKYRHFKGGLYTVTDIVENAYDGELVVVYRCDKTYKKYARKKSEFIEKLDKSKYPDTDQSYRFEEVILF